MVKPTDSKSHYRPIKQESVGRIVQLTATILRAGHVSSTVRIGANDVMLANSTIRDASGVADL